MNTARTLTTRAATAALVLAAIAAAMIAALVATANRTTPPAATPVVVDAAPADGFRFGELPGIVRNAGRSVAQQYLLAGIVGPGADLTPGQADELLRWADLTCEAFTAEVPVAVQTRTVMDELGLTGAEARQFVNTVAARHC